MTRMSYLQLGDNFRAVKPDFRKYIRRYTSLNENFEYGYPHSNALLQFRLESER